MWIMYFFLWYWCENYICHLIFMLERLWWAIEFLGEIHFAPNIIFWMTWKRLQNYVSKRCTLSNRGHRGVPRWSGINRWWADGSLKRWERDILTRSGKTRDRVLLTTMYPYTHPSNHLFYSAFTSCLPSFLQAELDRRHACIAGVA